MQGWRNNQEDSHIADLKLPNGEAIFGVFDGHGGKEVAIYVEKNFVSTLITLPEYKNKDYASALTKCFIKMDEQMDGSKTKNTPVSAYSQSAGCTANVVIIAND
jgi:serine/threonine protein phosphatase PrpC